MDSLVCALKNYLPFSWGLPPAIPDTESLMSRERFEENPLLYNGVLMKRGDGIVEIFISDELKTTFLHRTTISERFFNIISEGVKRYPLVGVVTPIDVVVNEFHLIMCQLEDLTRENFNQSAKIQSLLNDVRFVVVHWFFKNLSYIEVNGQGVAWSTIKESEIECMESSRSSIASCQKVLNAAIGSIDTLDFVIKAGRTDDSLIIAAGLKNKINDLLQIMRECWETDSNMYWLMEAPLGLIFKNQIPLDLSSTCARINMFLQFRAIWREKKAALIGCPFLEEELILIEKDLSKVGFKGVLKKLINLSQLYCEIISTLQIKYPTGAVRRGLIERKITFFQATEMMGGYGPVEKTTTAFLRTLSNINLDLFSYQDIMSTLAGQFAFLARRTSDAGKYPFSLVKLTDLLVLMDQCASYEPPERLAIMNIGRVSKQARLVHDLFLKSPIQLIKLRECMDKFIPIAHAFIEKASNTGSVECSALIGLTTRLYVFQDAQNSYEKIRGFLDKVKNEFKELQRQSSREATEILNWLSASSTLENIIITGELLETLSDFFAPLEKFEAHSIQDFLDELEIIKEGKKSKPQADPRLGSLPTAAASSSGKRHSPSMMELAAGAVDASVSSSSEVREPSPSSGISITAEEQDQILQLRSYRKSDDIIAYLKSLGAHRVRTGRHAVYQMPDGRTFPIPNHRELKPGTIGAIAKQAFGSKK